MPRQVATSTENNFRLGLITEASGLNYPENSCVETYDCVFDYVGTVTRRPGFNWENEYATKTIDRTGSVIASYYWRNVTGDGTVSFMVHQIGTKLYFYSAQNASLSLGAESSTVDLTAFSPSGAIDSRIDECQFADGEGKLYVTHPQLESFYVTYDGVSSFTATQISITIRDFDGLADSDASDLRPTGSLSTTKTYNLYNQGWDSGKVSTFNSNMSAYPSNSDVWWTFEDTSGIYDPTTTIVGSISRGNTPAPKGHFILNVYDQSRSTVSGVSGISDVSTGANRVSTCAFYAGRIFYAGLNYPGFESNIYFSQILLPNTDPGACYQKQDPTAEDLFDLLADDGGVVRIPEAGEIYKLFPMQSGMLVFAFRGVWLITGSTGIGFTATDYTVSKISNYNAISSKSFVEVNGIPIWWNYEGIFTIEGQATGVGALQVKSLSLTTINTFFRNIPNASKITARGVFDVVSQEVHWLYRSTLAVDIQTQYEFDSVLVLNIMTGAFYPWTISASDVKMHGVTVVYASPDVVELTVIDASGDTVIDASSDTIIAYNLSNLAQIPTFKYLVSYPDGSGSWLFTYAEANDTTRYVDFYTYDSTGVDYDSYFITGYKLRGQAGRKYQPSYVYFYNTGVGTFTVTGVWDYAINSNSNRYTVPQTLTFSDSNYSNSFRRIKIRGQGMSLQYKVESSSGQPFNVTGWASFDTINQLP